MQLQDKIIAIENHLAKYSQKVRHFEEDSPVQQVYHLLDELAEICKLLSAGIADLAAKTSQRATGYNRRPPGR